MPEQNLCSGVYIQDGMFTRHIKYTNGFKLGEEMTSESGHCSTHVLPKEE